MKKVISTKVDQAKYSEFLEYCARENKYPANALRDALELLLNSRVYTAAQKSQELGRRTVESRRAKTEQEIDEDEEELFG